MATYKDIQDWVRKNHNFVPKSCWIAHCKELNGIAVNISRTTSRQYPCPPNKRLAKEKAFHHFDWL